MAASTMREVGGGGGTLPGRPPSIGRGGVDGVREGPRSGGGAEARVWDGRPGAVGLDDERGTGVDARGAGVGATGAGVRGVDATGGRAIGVGVIGALIGRICVGAALRSAIGGGPGSELFRILTVALR